MKRSIKQISGSDNRIYALADDGTLWELNHGGEWTQHDPLPSDTVTAETLPKLDDELASIIRSIDHHIMATGSTNVGSLISALTKLNNLRNGLPR